MDIEKKIQEKFSVIALVMMIVGITTLIGSVIVWIAPYTGIISKIEGTLEGERAWIDKWMNQNDTRLRILEEKIRFLRDLHIDPHEHRIPTRQEE